MFFVLSKILQYLAMPLLWILALFVFSLFSKKQPLKRNSLLLGIVLFFLFTNPLLINEVQLAWEPEPVLLNQVENYQVGIVLTGVTEPNKSPHDRVHYGEGAERILDAIQLYKLGKIKKILISGGSGRITGVARTEAENLAQTALLAGVSQQDLWLEEKSRNTRENALYSKVLLDSRPDMKPLLLITSAFHMRRAKGCFEQVGLQVDTFPVDFHSHDRSFQIDEVIIPQAGALLRWSQMIHEWVGYVVYQLLGYA